MIVVGLHITDYRARGEVLRILRGQKCIQVLGAENGPDGPGGGCSASQPDVVLTHLAQASRSGLRVLEQANERYGESRPLVVLASQADSDGAKLLFRKGVSAMILEEAGSTELVPAIVAAKNGRRFVSAQLRDSLAAEYMDRFLANGRSC